MSTEPPRRPTDAELEILQVLWHDGPCTVRQVLDRLQSLRDVGYTTVLKLMQIMTEKGLVERDESERTHVYRASASRRHTQQHLVKDLMHRAFDDAAGQMALHALSTRKVSAEELAEIRRLLDDLEGKTP